MLALQRHAPGPAALRAGTDHCVCVFVHVCACSFSSGTGQPIYKAQLNQKSGFLLQSHAHELVDLWLLTHHQKQLLLADVLFVV